MGLSEERSQGRAPTDSDKNILESDRTGILVIIFGTLFLLSQLCLVIWILARPHAYSRREENEQSTATSPASSNSSIDADTGGDNFPRDNPEVRRSSTWSGAALKRQYLHQRKKSGGLDELVGLDTPLCNSLTDSDSDRSGVQQATRETIEEAIAMPMSAPPSTCFRNSPDNFVVDLVSDLEEFNPRKVWVDMGLVAGAIAKPRSPRSPRLNAADQAATMEALTADDVGIGAPSPTPVVVESADALASGYDNPLGMNRGLASRKKKEDIVPGASGSELRGRSV